MHSLVESNLVVSFICEKSPGISEQMIFLYFFSIWIERGMGGVDYIVIEKWFIRFKT